MLLWQNDEMFFMTERVNLIVVDVSNKRSTALSAFRRIHVRCPTIN